MPYTLYMPVTTMLDYFGGPPRPTQQLKVHPGLLRHLLHPCGRPLSHDFGLGLHLRDAELGFLCFFIAGFPFMAGIPFAQHKRKKLQEPYTLKVNT